MQINTKIFIAIGLLSMLMESSAHATERDKDGVPRIDIHGHIIVETPATTVNGFRFPEHRRRMIAFDDQSVPLIAFLNRFCMGKTENETCARGYKIGAIDGVSGPKDVLPPGL